ncbi:MAG TPA: hypothetical protein VEB59_06210, partial [Gemmatimonadales bacterium]|nr:hypothetical protein [Gemmatimonadales bacterium]
MGGTALLIYGSLSPERLRPRPLPRTWLDRLLRRTRERGPRVRPMGSREMVVVDAADLAPLAARFRAFLEREMPEPHEASKQILEYLDMDRIPNLYLRGERERGGEPDWYVQVSFSGCAGMAEVSAAVAEHWAAAWARRELPQLEREILGPFGFTPRAGQRFEAPGGFLPVEELGYLQWVPEEDREDRAEVFEADHAVHESIEDTPARLTDASRRYA